MELLAMLRDPPDAAMYQRDVHEDVRRGRDA